MQRAVRCGAGPLAQRVVAAVPQHRHALQVLDPELQRPPESMRDDDDVAPVLSPNQKRPWLRALTAPVHHRQLEPGIDWVFAR